MKRCAWILTVLILCAFAFPLSMTSSSQLGVQNAFAVEKNDPYSQDQPMTAKPVKKKRIHAAQKNAVKKDSVQKDATEKKAPARLGRKFKKKHTAEPAAVPAN